MTIYSMTGFGRSVAEGDNYIITAEIKSVNHRFKDVRFKMSSLFNSIEIDLKKALFNSVKRGTFEVFINYKKAETQQSFNDLDETKIKEFIETFKKMSGQADLTVQPTNFLRSEFYKDNDLSQDPELASLAKKALDGAVEALMLSRKSEGDKLKKVIEDHQNIYTKHFLEIESLSDKFQQSVEEKLRKRFEDHKDEIKVDEPRFLQEVVFYLEKMDVHEEINRIKAHLTKLSDLIEKGGECGRQIDFLIQELNRETNTIGSKSSMEEISNNVVQMKVQLEKIREQGLNLE